jgi:hypothetical protein
VSSITAGPGLVASSSSGEVTITAQQASTDTVGVVKIGAGITVSEDGTISSSVYTLPRAATNILGGIKVGNNLSINNEGVLSADAQNYVLPTASPTTKGGIQIGSGLEVVDGLLNVTVSEVASALQDGPATLTYSAITGQTQSILQSNFGVSLFSSENNFTSVGWSDNTDSVNQVITASTGTTIIHQNITEGTSTQWTFRTDGILVGPTIALGTTAGQDQLISLVDENNITFGNKDLKSYIRIVGPADTTSDSGNIPRANKISIISNNVDDFVNGQGFTSEGRIELIAGGGASPYHASITMGQLGDMFQDFPPTDPVETLTNHTEITGGVAFYGDVILQGASILGIRNKIIFQDGTEQTTAYQGESPAEITIDRLTNGLNEVILDDQGVLTLAGAIYSSSNVSIESITDTSITAGTDLKLFADGLFALRNYSTEDSIAITVNFNDVSQRSWLFNNNGSITFPNNTVQTTAYVSNITTESDDNSSVLIPGSTMSRGSLTVRVTVVNDAELSVEINYVEPNNTVKISGSNGTTNLFNGSIDVIPGNVIYYPITTTPLTQVGDIVTAIIADHSFGKMYRITAIYRDIPTESTTASVYCTIEQLI